MICLPKLTAGVGLVAALAMAVSAAASCSAPMQDDPSLSGTIGFKPQRPTIVEAKQVAPYTGSNATVRDAQERLGTGLDLHAKVIYRTCSPNGGVCHNNKEYPDLHTPANLLAAIDAPCNIQPGTPEAVFDRCERPGDRFKLADARDVEIGYILHIPGELKAGTTPTKTTPGLHVYLADPVGIDKKDVTGTARFVRTFVGTTGKVEQLTFASFDTRWWILDGGTHLFGQVNADRVSRVQELLTVGIVQGDFNRNGAFGARMGAPVPLLSPGKPEESYLIARLRGTMMGTEVPGSRMPLANQPLSVSEMLALFCFVEGLDGGGRQQNLGSMIDYARCSYSANPENLNLLGAGVTWTRRIKHILEFNCGGCHSGLEPQGGLDLQEVNVYGRLLGASTQKPTVNLIKPKAPAESYLWLKLIGDSSITGLKMPLNPLNGMGKLIDAELADIKAWIEAGAVENE